MKPVVGLIGVGTMGRIIADAVVKAGYELVATDPLPEAQKFAADLGARVVGSPGEVARCSKWILLSLPTPAHVAAVLTDGDSMAGSLSDEHIIVDTSTVDPQTTKRAANECAAKGARYLDAPILGRPASVGKWILPVGGDAEALESVQPLLEVFARRAIHVGPSGSGHAFKLLNQLMFATINGITAEVFAIADKVGISREKFYEGISNSGAATVSGLFVECGRKIIEEEYSSIFSIDLLSKDAGLGVEMAIDAGAPPIIASTVQTLIRLGQSRGLGSLDSSSLVNLYVDLYRSKVAS